MAAAAVLRLPAHGKVCLRQGPSKTVVVACDFGFRKYSGDFPLPSSGELSQVPTGVQWKGLLRVVHRNSGRKCRGTRARTLTIDSTVLTRPNRFPGMPRIVFGRLLLANQTFCSLLRPNQCGDRVQRTIDACSSCASIDRTSLPD